MPFTKAVLALQPPYGGNSGLENLAADLPDIAGSGADLAEYGGKAEPGLMADRRPDRANHLIGNCGIAQQAGKFVAIIDFEGEDDAVGMTLIETRQHMLDTPYQFAAALRAQMGRILEATEEQARLVGR